jgi:hypothetical protein
MGTRTTQDQFRQQQKSRRSTGSPRAGSEGDGTLPEVLGSGRRAVVRGDTGATVHGASRTSEADGPEPRAPQRRRARKRRKAERALRRRANGSELQVSPMDDRQGTPAPDAKRRGRPAAEETACGGEKEVSTGTN